MFELRILFYQYRNNNEESRGDSVKSLKFPVYLGQENSSVSSAGWSNENPTLSSTPVLISPKYNKLLNTLTCFLIQISIVGWSDPKIFNSI